MKQRKPGAKQQRGIDSIFSEIESIIADMQGYKSASESRRARELQAGLTYLEQLVREASKGNK